MKKVTLLTIATCFLILSSQAQIPKGTTFLGGTIGYSHSDGLTGSQEPHKQNIINLAPVVGKFIKDNLVAGLILNYSSNTISSDPSGNPYNRVYGGGVFVRKYKALGNRFYLFGEASLDATRNKSYTFSGIDYNISTKGFSINLDAQPGISYMVSKHLQLETALSNLFSIGYAHNKVTTVSIVGPTTTKESTFSINTNFSYFSNFNLGFRFFL